jgi:uncharacterized repeat protein (TIGR04138 family)
MASKHLQVKERTLEQVAADVGLYPPDAFEFVQQGLGFTVQHTHGDAEPVAGPAAQVSRHVSGQQLCEGLRQFALAQWGLLARAVLRRWNVTSTLDFGRIVFALIDAGQLQKTDDDRIDDFRAVYDFRTAFDAGYRIETGKVFCG